MTFSEVYIGLSQGTIDAQENPYEVIVSSKLYEQQKYAIQTNHLPHLISLIVSEDFFQKLTPEQQAIVQEAADNAKAYAREQAEERAENRIQIMEENGCEIVPLSDELLEEMRESAAPVYESIRKSVNDDALYNAYVGE
jgi:TRAP-type C4-dicarboxylate transport system substrate-binding protein